MANSETTVRIRMYRQGLGDCFLLTFHPESQPVHILIDCGTLGTSRSSVKMIDVVRQIEKDTGGHLHLLVVTHEHKDHVSGFATGSAVFDSFKVDQVWVAWTEKPADPLAMEITRSRDELVTSLRFASERLRTNRAPDRDERKALAAIGTGIRALLNFDGDLPTTNGVLAADIAKTVREAMNYASRLAGWPPQFLDPGQVLEPAWLPGVRFFVLGPPHSEKALKVLGKRGSPELYALVARQASNLAGSVAFLSSGQSLAEFRDSLDGDAQQLLVSGLPFDARFRIEGKAAAERRRFYPTYDDPRFGWRRIDNDWLVATEDFALQLDELTNNTSLVLAIELIDDGRVLLFPGDAQLGNWQSWKEVSFSVTGANGESYLVTAADLLSRTVFYKVGHHASYNATRAPDLEAMKSDDLVAMIPVDSEVAGHKHWRMPEKALFSALLKQTHGRVLRSDTGWPAEKPDQITQSEWDTLRKSGNIQIDKLFIDYCLS